MAWDFSAPPPRASKWWTVRSNDLERQERTARRLRRDLAGLPRLRPVRPPQPEEWTTGQELALEAFIERHARDLRPVLDRARTKHEEMTLAASYRAALAGAPGAWTEWVRLVREGAERG